MKEKQPTDYGLAITNNSKAGPAFSLPRSRTCIFRTAVCTNVCYGKGIRYQTKSQKEKRARNYRTVEFLLEKGGSALLAENLVILVDQARPVDWIAARITGTKTRVPWTFRIHDVGDYPEFKTIQSSKISERRIEMVSDFAHHLNRNTRHSF